MAHNNENSKLGECATLEKAPPYIHPTLNIMSKLFRLRSFTFYDDKGNEHTFTDIDLCRAGADVITLEGMLAEWAKSQKGGIS